MTKQIPTRARVIRDTRASRTDPLRAQAGERLNGGRRDQEWPGWIWCTDARGRSGWTPEAWLEIDQGEICLLRDYDAQELSAQAGDTVRLIEEAAGWFWAQAESGAEGWLPGDCLEIWSSAE